MKKKKLCQMEEVFDVVPMIVKICHSFPMLRYLDYNIGAPGMKQHFQGPVAGWYIFL